MQRIIGVVLVAAGAVMGWRAWQAHESVAGQLTNAISGSASNQTLLMAGTAVVALLAGLYLALR